MPKCKRLPNNYPGKLGNPGSQSGSLSASKALPLVLALLCMPIICLGEIGGENGAKQTVDGFVLRDYRGQKYALRDFCDDSFVVVAFVGVECPLSKLYAPRLEQLRQEYASRKIAFIGIDSNFQDSPADLAAFVRDHQLTFPLLRDAGNKVANQFGAQRTPEVFVLDKDQAVRYQGRIDDQYGRTATSGYARPKAEHRDLATALDELLAGKEVGISKTVAAGCLIGRTSAVTSKGSISYCNQIARILQQRCVNCHRKGEIAPFPLTEYEEVVGWANTIREALIHRRMPPWFASPAHGSFTNNNQMSNAERERVYAWIDDGCPRGEDSDLPSQEVQVGWQISTPDQVVYLSPEPVDVPAQGVIDYRYYTVDPGWVEDKWIRAIEVRPSNRAVVHHIILYFKQPGDNVQAVSRNNLGGYVPGAGVRFYADGVAVLVPANSKLVFQMHYTPNGSPQKDRSYAGFIFAQPNSVQQVADTGAALNSTFAIPPGADDYQVEAQHHFNKNVRLLWLSPHMHLRGKSFRFEARYPDGSREILLDVPHYDFSWQISYRLAEPKPMPSGTVLHCTAHFDNSHNNLANPDPTATVLFGPQTWHEMMIGWFGTVTDKP